MKGTITFLTVASFLLAIGCSGQHFDSDTNELIDDSSGQVIADSEQEGSGSVAEEQGTYAQENEEPSTTQVTMTSGPSRCQLCQANGLTCDYSCGYLICHTGVGDHCW